MNKIYAFLFGLALGFPVASFSSAQVPQPVKRFLSAPELNGASFALAAKDTGSGDLIYRYDEGKSLTPASVMKLVTTATALDLLGSDFRFETVLEYDGKIEQGVLRGNLYIRGGGDPSLGSAFFADDRNAYHPDDNAFMPQWIEALTKAGIHTVNGRVIADERVFDSVGVSGKWMVEDLGNYYAAGSYGLSVFDNRYSLLFRSGSPGEKLKIKQTVPTIEGLRFHNNLTAASIRSDSAYISGMPFANERYLHGVVPAGRENYILRGDIPDPALFLAEYTTEKLVQAGFEITGKPTCCRLLAEKGTVSSEKRTPVCVTLSPRLAEIAGVTNEVSHNLYADALLKTVGLRYQPQHRELISSAERGVKVVLDHWRKKGLDTSALKLYDGSGLAATDKVTAAFICDLLLYMSKESSAAEAFMQGIPRVGADGSVRNFLKGSQLQGRASLKSGGMGGVRAYAGYIRKDNRTYAVALIVNNYAGESRLVTKEIEKLLLSLF